MENCFARHGTGGHPILTLLSPDWRIVLPATAPAGIQLLSPPAT
jgi:hypothetical protein